jgi:hypothetical protein
MLEVLQEIGHMMGADELTAAPLLVTGAEPLAATDRPRSRNAKGRPKKAVRAR